MTIAEASKLLYLELKDKHWFSAVGIIEHNSFNSLAHIVLYVNSLDSSDFTEQNWCGFSVIKKEISLPKVEL